MLHARVLNAGLPNAMGGYDEKPEDMDGTKRSSRTDG
jgi:methionine synthase I (cobalamin-dependent)